MFVSADGMKMRGMKNETNGSAKANKVVSEGGSERRRREGPLVWDQNELLVGLSG